MKIVGQYYQMDPEEKAMFDSFLSETIALLPVKRHNIFLKLMIKLAEIQEPYNKKYPFIDSLYHGITVAKFCIMLQPKISEVLLIAAIGHDWDRACGEKRIKSTDFLNTKKGNEEYKRQHARNSAELFEQVLQEFYETSVVEQVTRLIMLHEVGGEGDLEILDQADGLTMILPKVSNYYRLGRSYKGPDGEKLSDADLEEARKKGYAIKVKFMTETMNPEALAKVKTLAKENKDSYDPRVQTELFSILGI